jgi:hypothetical protein
MGDILYDERLGVTEIPKALEGLEYTTPMVPVIRAGRLHPEFVRRSLEQHRENAQRSLASLSPALRRIDNNSGVLSYPVLIDPGLEAQRQKLFQQHRTMV